MKSYKLPGLHQVVSQRQNVTSFDSLTLISASVQYLMCLGNLVSTTSLQPNLCIAGAEVHLCRRSLFEGQGN